MNIELKPRVPPFSVSEPAPANDNTEPRPPAGPSRRRAIIYKPAKSAVTSGRAGTKRWLLEFEPQSAPFIEPLMGWTGSIDPLAQVRLTFPSRDAAIAYAKRQGIDYEVRDAAEPARPCRVVEKPRSRSMPLWPIGLHPEWNSILAPEISGSNSTPGLAA